VVQGFGGPGTAFEQRASGDGWQLPHDFPDGSSNTILITHAAKPVPWTKPEDLVYDPEQALPDFGGRFRKSLPLLWPARSTRLVAMADGSVRELSPDISEASLRPGITRNDGKPLGDD